MERKDKKFSRRDFLRGAAMVGGASVLAACAQPTPTPAPAAPTKAPAAAAPAQPAAQATCRPGPYHRSRRVQDQAQDHHLVRHDLHDRSRRASGQADQGLVRAEQRGRRAPAHGFRRAHSEVEGRLRNQGLPRHGLSGTQRCPEVRCGRGPRQYRCCRYRSSTS